MTAPSPIQDQTTKPPGLLPKNVQSWLLVGLAVLMVVIMWLTGGKKPAIPSKAVPAAPAVLPPLGVNEAKIVDLQKRIEELQREQVAAQNALAQQARALALGGSESQTSQPSTQAYGNQQERPEDAIQAERKKRDYLSLFASNVALTYRKGTLSGQSREEPSLSNPFGTETSAAQLADFLKPFEPPAVP